MTSSYKDNIENYYQLADGVVSAGTELANSELIDFATGLPLIDDATDEVLTGDSLETIVLTDSGKCTPIVISDDPNYAVLVNVTNRPQSEVEVSLLGIPKQETALALFDTVNIYGVNSKEWLEKLAIHTAMTPLNIILTVSMVTMLATFPLKAPFKFMLFPRE
jgi:hypothetical protein